MIFTRIFPPEGTPIDLDAADAREKLRALYEPGRQVWLRLNFVASVSGSVIGSDGTSNTLSSRSDRVLLGVIRGLSDVVLVGAETVRREGYGVPRRAALAIVTSSGDLSGHRIASDGDRGRVLVLCPASATESVLETLGEGVAEVVQLADAGGILAARDITGALRERGYASIVCEGGPSLAAQLVAGGEVDELCLSTSPLLGGAPLALFGPAALPESGLALTQLMTDDSGSVYARWSLAGGRASSR